jgi:alpha-methylacyl-CoA racemase
LGPLHGVKVIEMGGLGPGPYCAMVLSDLGAEVLRVDRAVETEPDIMPEAKYNVLNRGRRSVAVNLKHAEGAAVVLRLVESADVLIEGFRPGVMERLGLSPEACWQHNPELVYGRITGWGQDGPLAQTVGHDINYLALTGALHAIGRPGSPPAPPLSLVGDFGGGGASLAIGILAALLEARTSGKGQVVDASIVDGVALLLSSVWGRLAAGSWRDQRGANVLDGGAPYYEVYATLDEKFVSVGAIEPKFYRNLLRVLGLAEADLPPQNAREHWPETKARFAAVFRTRSRDEWEQAFIGVEACFAPVLTLEEAARHPHNVARGTFVHAHGVRQASPAPRFSRTPGAIQGPAPVPGQHTNESLRQWGFDPEAVKTLRARGVVGA